ncbi:hypothetical protein UFOVP1492_109 [uncultured Caudovirales phage]|uniref:Uncharacterized protein n=1 Tax=uncultured Caudovirales phage TaxID=2100421 RepID=A0A6J7XSE0_9CAUD|nr:hypothetical protein UFOVP1127_25 [uncultured Caudovirales phage]CAB4193258.1 hypothetical protein UFOVP1242_49 [uncultured Caudovirales phage]CAB4217861.1 hypothetical protein UFOVP1492_109 [uncultured Caudovirales phage]CAB5230922.1 hypothetical protein UFOVP1580_2 [uncultured Caudovirales phage]
MPNNTNLLVSASGATTGALLGAGTNQQTAVRDNDGATGYIYAPGSVGGARVSSFLVEGNMFPPHEKINLVTISAYVAADTGTVLGMQVILGVRIGGTTYSGTTQAVSSTTYTLFTSSFLLNPATSAAWTKYELDTLEVVVSLDGGAGTAQCRCSQLYAAVSFEAQTDALLFGS